MLIVPIVLLRHTVANGALIEPDELIPESWNGVPVTVGHPTDGGGFATANSPETLSRWHVGRIFNAGMDGDKLKGEAWIEVKRANKVAPGLIPALEAGEEMDVSTGYFSKKETATGSFKGKRYTVAHRDLKPDHLALLPGESGACSWADGCGVRANRGQGMSSKIRDALQTLAGALGIETQERGYDDDVRQMRADLISDDRSPFKPEDEDSLRMMSAPALRELRNKFLRTNSKGVEMDSKEKAALVEKITANSKIDKAALEAMSDDALKAVAAGIEPDANADKDKKPGDGGEKKPDALTAESIAEIVTNTLKEALPKMVPAALAEQERPALIARVTAGGKIDKATAEAMPIETLRAVAGAVAPIMDFSGRGGAPASITAFEKDDPAASMVPQDIGDVIRANAKAREAA